MSSQWFCRIMGDEWGPMSAQELMAVARRGRLTRDDLVRHGSDGDWVRAETVCGLFDSPPSSSVPTQIAMPATSRWPVRPASRSLQVVRARYWVRSGAQIAGPFSTRQLLRFAAIGKLRPEYLFSSDRNQWRPVSEIKSLRFANR